MSLSLEEEIGMPSQKRRPTHRGRRGRGKGPKPDAHAEAKQHAQNAANASTPQQSHAHLFKALSALKKC